MYKFALLTILLTVSITIQGQHWGLFNTGTLYDSFENPAQKAFIADTSKRIAFNFLIPTGGLSVAGRGPADNTIRQLFYSGPLDTKGLDNNSTQYNRIFADQNIYLGMLRIFKTVKYNREFGLSWQVKTEGDYAITNQTFTTFQNPLVEDKTYYKNTLNDYGKAQSYHQFSLTYREDYNKRLAFGAKLSYLSGMLFSKLSISQSELAIDQDAQVFNASLKGYYLTNFLYNNFSKRSLIPHIQNPGLALSAGFNYRTLSGLYILGNIKDLGFIMWRKTPYKYTIDEQISIDASSPKDIDKQLTESLKDDVLKDPTNERFTSSINGKAQILLSKTYDRYQPNLILSKNLFNQYGNAVLVNNYNYRAWKFSLTSGYDFRGIFELGGQIMYKKPNVEFFLGSDRLFKTIALSNGISAMQADLADRRQNDIPKGKGYTGASAYLGFALKFGKVLYHWQNSSEIPGVEPAFSKKPKKSGKL
ncbi:DUF5723 family protein [Desertivirga brevis]|uniref:DUF5723 family protein n=1 Tax=Desertivirga brevis TaxID=2810310 RepID=UPI001A97A8B7|nr:DUF5723 family protein [Pedobacter sp. SYSU D00873]